jgi:acyl dehydratase/NAD(P)-dependent dehydrogenase (short-subunit alcohol dehydrogenase family)
VIERELRFTGDHMELFAAASGDRSPLHTDPAFARRTSFGECIVYGGLLSIGMLGLLPAEVLAGVRSVRSQFPGPVLPGASTTARAQSRGDRADEWEVVLSGRGKVLARLVATTGAGVPASFDQAAVLERFAASAGRGGDDEIAGDYRPGAELAELARGFGLERLEPAVLEGIAWASNVVGMTIPGFDGLCAAVTIVSAGAVAPGAAARQWIRRRAYDERTDRLLIEGVLADDADVPRSIGLIECFPFSPTPLPDSVALTAEGPLEPAQRTAVVVGASRGVGAALSLALLARGYAVHAIYWSSAEQADELIRLAGPFATRLSLHRIDAADPASVSAVARLVGPSIDGVALCAAPPALPMGLTGESAAELADYVARSVSLAAVPLASLLPLLAREDAWVLFCSASAVTNPSRELPQFTVAKAALEGLARWVAATTPNGRILLARPSRVRTDLVNTPSGRLAAVAPDALAATIVGRLATGDLAHGLSIVDLDEAAVSAV